MVCEACHPMKWNEKVPGLACQSLDDIAQVLGNTLYMLRYRMLNESCFSPLDRAIPWSHFILLMLALFRSVSMPIGVRFWICSLIG
jgi:hypothetical protein